MSPWLALYLFIDPALARAYLADLHTACQSAQSFWHHDLCGPVVLVDPANRAYVTADSEGTLPQNVGLANTAVDWNGKKWTMILWPLPLDPNQRLSLMIHESFHRIQGSLGLPMSSPDNPHLDTLAGRYYLQLEWRALAAALHSTGAAQRKAAADAIAFRRLRRNMFSGAATSERLLEMNEGLAQYTGDALSGAPVRLALLDLEQGAQKSTYVRSFAYATGPAYGLLLDQHSKTWRASVKQTDDLADLLAKAMNLEITVDPYNSGPLLTQELERDQASQRRVAALRKLLVDDPVLVLPLEQMSMELNPDTLVPLGDAGTVYPTITVRDLWGSIDVTDNALLSSDFKKLTVPAQSTWKLDLKPTWKVTDGPRKGDQTITRQ